ncbi:hypothetical protein H5410_040332 [Solanum commersonii]|uniref:DUF4283 domain-containing protein n=1 Tax=Solanum commersonii TaxID=4109 RepID=A0A9J5XPU3_SOLCO|nr:hypothetical protein H5410_040332 [Solanum commersonii]
MVDKEIPYAESVRRSRWSSKEINSAVIKERGDTILINGKSLVGSFPTIGSEMATLSEVCRWVSKNWNQAHGLNVYEMGNNCFLIQFTSINSAAMVSWIRLVGLPLHLWSQNVFKAVGDVCRGWVKTEEETNLRNHLKWAKILVKANGNSIPKEVKIAFEGIEYIIQVWDETPTRFFAGESAYDIGGDRRTQSSNQCLLQKDWTSEPLLDEIQANYRNLVALDKEGDPVHLFHGDRDENF